MSRVPLNNLNLNGKMFLALSILLSCTSTVVSRSKDIRVQRDFFTCPVFETFNIYWNVPTFMCAKYGINFAPFTEKWKIYANDGDSFRGDVINILYDPGLFPAMLEGSTSGRLVERNGGIPQAGNITQHLEAFESIVDQLVPKNFAGPAIIDFEAYRPIWRQNWGKQVIYQNMSIEEVRQYYPQWTEKEIERTAALNFEAASKIFLKYSIELGKLLRPKAKWGYYGYPYCYNFRQNTGMLPACESSVQEENNRLQWLFDDSGALYPSIYMTQKLRDTSDQKRFVMGRMNEAVRMACRARSRTTPNVYPYLWYKYYDSINFLSSGDLYQAIETVRKYKMGGLVIWGATNDVTSKEKCLEMLDYLNNTLGPTIHVIRSKARLADEAVEEQQVGSSALDPEIDTKEIFNSSNPAFKFNKVQIPPNYEDNSIKQDSRKKYKCPPNQNCSKKTRAAAPNLPFLNAYMQWYERVVRAILNVT